MYVLKNSLDNLLLDTQIISSEQMRLAVKHSETTGLSLIKSICDLNILEKEELYSQIKNALEIQYGLTFTDLSGVSEDAELLNIFSKELMIQHKFLPIQRSGNVFVFGMVNPDNILADREIQDRLREFKNITINKTVILEDDFNEFIEKNFVTADDEHKLVIEQNTDEIISSMGIDIIESYSDDIDLSDLNDSAEEAPVIQLANSILGIAIKRGVSDIHIEPREKELIVRFRQDGVLSVYKKIPKRIQNALVSRYKIMAELDISERRLPQDGRIRVKMLNKTIDFRVSSLPSKFGEKIVMRILDKSNISFGLDQLITNQEILNIVRDMIYKPFGIIFVTGPTGSGKTTTLYSALSERNTDEINISTAEDPVEYDLNGITQSEINKVIGFDFSRILKAFLRQDPDIMLVGETRDKETAKIAIEAALTGHLVFTTLHTNDAPGAIMRLQEMEVEPFLIASSTIGVIAQRLLRRICANCKEEYTPDEQVLKFLGIENRKAVYYKGKGCKKCNNTGYKGRVGAYEVMKINDDIRDLIAKEANTTILRYAAQEAGMKTLVEYSLDLAGEGLTTLDEVIRVTFTGEGSSMICPGCSRPVGEDYYKCPFCQHELKKTCLRCGVIVKKGWVSCAKCGLKLVDELGIMNCSHCNGDISLDMAECPWCCNDLLPKNINK
ncbi:MAG TPA: ATPase, T2SS/T4P/T4SS family [Candidatus Gastranaerophilales bacterium]|nr:ATPase, T2SS/T4P/T4SS family [Candidatus Gastranaerophilales bacterium]